MMFRHPRGTSRSFLCGSAVRVISGPWSHSPGNLHLLAQKEGLPDFSATTEPRDPGPSLRDPCVSPCPPHTAGGGPEAAAGTPCGRTAADPPTAGGRGAQGGAVGEGQAGGSCWPSWSRSVRSSGRGCPRRSAGACWARHRRDWGTGIWSPVPATVTRLGAVGTCPALTQRARRRLQSSELAEQEVATRPGWALGGGQEAKTLNALFFFFKLFIFRNFIFLNQGKHPH